MDCTGVYDTDGNLTNVTISDEKKAEILSSDFTGSGTSTDPYQVNSSLGFWFMSKFVTLTNKYVELNCDVILNDETFDENGNASGGDGVVYSWNGFASSGSDFNINGKDNSVFGLYIDNIEKSYFSLFGKSQIDKLENFNLAKSFVKIKSNSAMLVCYVNIIQNCNVFDCMLNSSMGYCAGIVYHVEKSLLNCSNYCNLIGNDAMSGIVCFCSKNEGIIERGMNYGNISGAWSVSGIIAAPNTKNLIIRDCKNYGNLNSKNWAGGIIGMLYEINTACNLINCANYGNINSDVGSAGLIAYADGMFNMEKCNIYGKITSGRACGGFICNIAKSQYNEKTEINIINCRASFNQDISLIYYVSSDSHISININCVYLEFKTDIMKNKLIVSHNNSAKIYINNLDISVCCSDFKSNMVNKPVEKIQNLILKVNSENISNNQTNYICPDNTNTIQNVVVILKSETLENKHYYGSNFSGFYVSWRTGKIGLKALDGVGYFQGAIDEEWLGNNGFVKKG